MQIGLAMFASVCILKTSVLNAQPATKTATGINAFSIWMNETERCRYAAFPSQSVPASSAFNSIIF